MALQKILIALALNVISICSCAQEKFISITGKVVDSHTGSGIPFVNIRLKTNALGTATNSAGEFIFKFPEKASKDTLLITCIGYKPARRSLQAITSNLAIAMEPAIVELATVTVNARTGLDILKEAIRRIPENYDTSDVQFTAFYRENTWIADFELAYSEAVLDIYRPFHPDERRRGDSRPNDQIRIIKGRKKKIDYGREGQLYYWMSGSSNGARGCLSEDFVKYYRAKYSPLNQVNFKYYNYEYTETIREGNRNLIVLDIIPKKIARKGYLPMKVFLEETSLAFVRLNFELSERGLRVVSRKDKGIAYTIMSSIVHATREYHKFQYSVSYSQHNNKWYLNRVTRHWEIFVNSKKRNWEDHPWRLDADLLITNVQTENVKPLTEGDISKHSGPIHAMVSAEFDDAFWENYNVLKSESSNTLQTQDIALPKQDTTESKKNIASNRQNGFTRADTLRGKLTPLRTCYDVTFYHLDVDIDMEKRSLTGSNLIRFAATQPFTRMQVDLFANMKINKILFNNEVLPYSREYNAVYIDFPEIMKPGVTGEIKIFYEGIPKEPDWNIPMNGGVLWDKDSLGNAWAQVVCQGLGASLWWPNKDHQSDEPDSMKIWITVPSEYTEISNGRLLGKTPLPGNKTRYEWYVSYPINNYNVTFNIGKYAHFRDHYISDDTLSIDYYVMPYNLQRAKRMFTQVHPMLKAFEKYFGKYPFKRDGFALVESLYPMEHQSGVCIGKITPETLEDANLLLWHESAHEWWGNAVTCKDIADMWIHEAFATYAETLVLEERFGKEAAIRSIVDQADAVIGNEPVIGVYDVNHIHYEIGDMYSKGSLIIHTFRSILENETLWIDLLQAIQNRFRYQTLSSDDLVEFINEHTQTDYTYFFDQYLRHENIPSLQLSFEDKGTSVQVKYRWQADVEDFRMPVKVTTTPDKFGFIYPTTMWKTLQLKNMSAAEFEVDEDNFYIDLIAE